MYTNSFSVIEIEGGAGFTDQAITIILEPFRIRILVSFSTKKQSENGLLSSFAFILTVASISVNRVTKDSNLRI